MFDFRRTFKTSGFELHKCLLVHLSSTTVSNNLSDLRQYFVSISISISALFDATCFVSCSFTLRYVSCSVLVQLLFQGFDFFTSCFANVLLP